MVTVREEIGGVDSGNFYNWACDFVRDIVDLTAYGRKVLLIYDMSSTHMSLRVLELFLPKNVIVYALPAHTSVKTQQLDVVVFSPFKEALNAARRAVWQSHAMRRNIGTPTRLPT